MCIINVFMYIIQICRMDMVSMVKNSQRHFRIFGPLLYNGWSVTFGHRPSPALPTGAQHPRNSGGSERQCFGGIWGGAFAPWVPQISDPFWNPEEGTRPPTLPLILRLCLTTSNWLTNPLHVSRSL